MNKLILQFGRYYPTIAIVYNEEYIEFKYCKSRLSISKHSKNLHNLMEQKYEDMIVAYTDKINFEKINTKHFIGNKSVYELFLKCNITIKCDERL